MKPKLSINAQITPDVQEKSLDDWFELSCAQYLTVPRSVLNKMPEEWKTKFAAMLFELDDPHAQYRPQISDLVDNGTLAKLKHYEYCPGIDKAPTDKDKFALSVNEAFYMRINVDQIKAQRNVKGDIVSYSYDLADFSTVRLKIFNKTWDYYESGCGATNVDLEVAIAQVHAAIQDKSSEDDDLVVVQVTKEQFRQNAINELNIFFEISDIQELVNEKDDVVGYKFAAPYTSAGSVAYNKTDNSWYYIKGGLFAIRPTLNTLVECSPQLDS